MEFSVTLKSQAGACLGLTADKVSVVKKALLVELICNTWSFVTQVMEFSVTVKSQAGVGLGLTKPLMLIYYDL